MKTLSIPNDILIPQIKRVIDEGKSVTFLVKGYSMRLFLDNNRDKVILAPCEKDKVKPGDVVLVAGKGHENYQEIKGVKHHFDDKEELKKIMN